MTEHKPYINDITDIEIVLEDDDHVILRLLSRHGWTSCRVEAQRLLNALAKVEADVRQSVHEQLRQLRGPVNAPHPDEPPKV